MTRSWKGGEVRDVRAGSPHRASLRLPAALLAAGETHAALWMCRMALRHAPYNHKLLATRASIYIKLEKWNLAERDISLVIKSKPRWYQGHFLRGVVLAQTGNYLEALVSLTVAMALGKNAASTRGLIVHAIEKFLIMPCRSSALLPKPRFNSSILELDFSSFEHFSSHEVSNHIYHNEYTLFRILLRKTKKMLKIISEKEDLHSLEVDEMEVMTAELECVLCCRLLMSPVTTPCGHTYCRGCIERCMDYSQACPLCMAPLAGFLAGGGPKESAFINEALTRLPLSARPSPPDQIEHLLPVFVCTAAFPAVSCPLFVFEPRYRLMVRRCLESGTRRFGIVASANGRTASVSNYADYGTVLEIRDCIRMPDGCSILSTVGISRFRVIARGELDGYDVARVEVVTDKLHPNSHELRKLHASVRQKALVWIEEMDSVSRDEIEQTFGKMPPEENEWQNVGDGPAWTWWVLAILPLATQLKVMILATDELVKRLRAIDRTLDFIYFVAKKQNLEGEKNVIPDALDYDDTSTQFYSDPWMLSQTPSTNLGEQPM